MADVDYEQAVQTLRSHLGARYEAVEANGRDDMRDVLRDQLGYSNREADEAIDAMIAAGTLRYHRAAPETDRGDVAAVPPAGALPAAPAVTGGGATSTAGAPVVPVPIGGGYWQIGAGDEAESGRKGQVTPE
jgi:hypothetical protein